MPAAIGAFANVANGEAGESSTAVCSTSVRSTAVRSTAVRSTAADIGSDHGRLAAALLQRGVFSRVIATDVSADSLAKAAELKELIGFGDELELRVGDGLRVIGQGEADTIFILGMGGKLIADILNSAGAADGSPARSAHSIIMQPMRGVAELREFLYNNHYRITDERMVLDAGRIYQLIRAQSGEPLPFPAGWPQGMYEYGALMVENRDPLLCGHLRKQIAYNEARLKKAPPQSAEELRHRTERLKALFTLMEEA